MSLRACLKIRRGAVFAEKTGWRGATKENIPGGSSTEEQRSQPAFSAKNLRAAGLLFAPALARPLQPAAGMARASPPWPTAKIPSRSTPPNFQTGSEFNHGYSAFVLIFNTRRAPMKERAALYPKAAVVPTAFHKTPTMMLDAKSPMPFTVARTPKAIP